MSEMDSRGSFLTPTRSRALERFVADLVEAWNAHDVDRAAALHASDYEGVDVADATPRRGPEGIRQSLTRYLRAFPDLHFTPEETIVQGNRAVLLWTARGTHQGTLMNIPPTGRAVAVRGMSLLTVQGNQARRGVHIWDVAGMLRAIGLLPEL